MAKTQLQSSVKPRCHRIWEASQTRASPVSLDLGAEKAAQLLQDKAEVLDVPNSPRRGQIRLD